MVSSGFVFQEYERYRNTSSDALGGMGLKPGISYFGANTCDLSGERVRIFNIDLAGDEFYVIDGYFLLYRKGKITIYKYDSSFNFSRTRSISNHLLTFLIKKHGIGRRCRFFFYNVLLHLIKNGERRCDFKLRDIMQYMCIDWLRDVKTCGEGVVCFYRNGESRTYDSRLQVVSGSSERGWRGSERVIENRVQTVRISKNGVEIAPHGRSFKDVLAIRDIRQHMALDDSLFVLTRDSVKVLSFGD